MRGAAKAARAQVLATHAAAATVRIGVAAQVAQAYFALIALDSQVDAARRSLALRERDLELQNVRHRAGLIGDQQEAEVVAARAQVPALERDRAAQELALAMLLGRSPRAIMSEVIERGGDTGALPPPVVPDGLPSELLLRRPDLYETEQRLIAANAQIGVAGAAYFPRIPLTGYVGSERAALADLFTAPGRIWQVTAALTQPLFQGGRLRARSRRRAPARDLRGGGRSHQGAGGDAAACAHSIRQRSCEPTGSDGCRAQSVAGAAQSHRRAA